MEPRSPALQADSLPSEPQGKPKNTGVGSLSFPQGIFPTLVWNQGFRGFLHCRQILYQLRYQRNPPYRRRRTRSQWMGRCSREAYRHLKPGPPPTERQGTAAHSPAAAAGPSRLSTQLISIFLCSEGRKLRQSDLYCYLTKILKEGDGTPLQYSCLENPMDGGAWWASIHGVAKSRTRLSDFTFTFHFHALEKEMATHSSVLAWRVPGTAEPGGLPSMGLHRVRYD